MSTMRVEDISRKKPVPQRYQPNSYRIFSDEIGNGSIPDSQKYSNQAPELYTQPMIVPAQAIEDRNKPHGGRAAAFLRENARTLNEPVPRVNTRAVNTTEEKRWWEWNLPVEQGGHVNSLKKRSSSTSNINKDASVTVSGKPGEAYSGGSGFQTTYQNCFLATNGTGQPSVKVGGLNENQGSAQRHTYNPNSQHAVGIIPINDLNNFNAKNAAAEPRTFVDKMSFEQQYDSRKDTNYPVRGKRQGAYVVEQVEPKPRLGTKNYVDQNKGASVWDAMHLDQPSTLPPVPQRHSAAPPLSYDQYRNQRRDPFGYYEDPKFGAPKPPLPPPQQQQAPQQHMPQMPPPQSMGDYNPPNEISYQTQQLAYRPSWNGTDAGDSPSFPPMNGHGGGVDLLDKAMAYQRPLINGH